MFHLPGGEGYRPTHSLFQGRPTPYPEVPERTAAIRAALAAREEFALAVPQPVGPGVPGLVHSAPYIAMLDTLCARLKPDEEFFPAVFGRYPLLLASTYPRMQAGYYALDTTTPLVAQSYAAALGGAAVAAAGARALLAGDRMAYSLCRPPGHHAGRACYAGYCLFNNAALAAELLAPLGRRAILDIDFHHGNGTQDIFYERDDVLYVSIHCRPEQAYPYVAGTHDETGAGRGRGYNVNLPLDAGADWPRYAAALETALEAVQRFRPAALLLSLGFDTLAQDPIGAFRLEVGDFLPMGRAIAQLLAQVAAPLLIVQEGGYHVPSLGQAALNLFAGLGLSAEPATAGAPA
ncbi:MAG: histone deacetylase family protein [Candidatus Lambdaproteobacteria bacterium]|nr:histone deacetylase family protein [Candidatus Lambdaproteobacteria bacterium]